MIDKCEVVFIYLKGLCTLSPKFSSKIFACVKIFFYILIGKDDEY